LLSEILARLATYLENTERLRKKVKTALMYPTVVTIVAIVITIFLMVKVIPTFKEVYTGFGAALPKPTEYMIDLSEFLTKYLLYMIVAAGLSVWGWLYFIKTKQGREFWDTQRIKLPVFGAIAHKICLARFTRTLASLVRSGVPILEVLQIVSQTVGNVVMEKSVKSAASDIERGEGIAAALGKYPVFPTAPARSRLRLNARLSAALWPFGIWNGVVPTSFITRARVGFGVVYTGVAGTGAGFFFPAAKPAGATIDDTAATATSKRNEVRKLIQLSLILD